MNKLILQNQQSKQSGQTLIETLVAALVLVMGISAAVGLAVYGLGATNGVTKQLVAVGLAREGIEAVKNIRDTNWLSTPIQDCYDFYTGGDKGAKCYPNWDDGIKKNVYVLGINADPTAINTSNYWQLTPSSAYGLNFSTEKPAQGFYFPSGTSQGNSGYSRKITLTPGEFAPFNRGDLGVRLKVHIDVWWTDKRCPASDDVSPLPACKVSLETYLTNWKNY